MVDQRGHDPRSTYVERYWLSVLGPTATWIMRRFAECFDTQPDGFVLDLTHTATSMGLSFSKNVASPFGKALHRCVMFGIAQPTSDGFTVRRRLPSVAQRHLRRTCKPNTRSGSGAPSGSTCAISNAGWSTPAFQSKSQSAPLKQPRWLRSPGVSLPG